jgi:hypothetical protein
VEPLEVEAVTGVPVRAAAYARTDLPHGMTRQCNQIDIGFRNAANCPLHGYYIAEQKHQQHPKLSGSKDGSDPSVQMCPVEEFKLHLGMEPVTPDFHWDWQSNTKFEGSAIGHTFAFRLASNPSILVETVTLEPTKITDCPARSPAQEITELQITADRIIVPVHRRLGHGHGHQNVTAETLLEYYANATAFEDDYHVQTKRSVSGSRYGAASAGSF